VKKNGTSIYTTAPSIAFNATTRRRRDAVSAVVNPTGGSANGNLAPPSGEPGGVPFQAGDYFRLDVTAIPGTTSSDLSVSLSIVCVDV
jgi:hypothetical protein